ncbi:MAG: hypothetical protein LDLANPLL_02369 [Turneriella sp.]|nr:hypothetical protein [Turneriella sp.]
MHLEERLRAYGLKAKAVHEKNGVYRENISHFHFSAHPISNESARLPSTLAINFYEDLNRDDFLFFDLESTGLGSSEQVYPFLIGYANAGNTGANLTILFANTPADEKDILANFLSVTQEKVLVSFNGKSFDLPLILRRAEKYNLLGYKKPKAHLDLYHIIRRIYPEKPARLIDAESRLLNFSRTDDLNGSEVAQAYFEFLQFNNGLLKDKIITHNTWDILSLINLTTKISTAFKSAREGRVLWAYKIHRDKSADNLQKKKLLIKEGTIRDEKDEYALGKIFRHEKDYRRAARHFILSYRLGYASAVVDAVRALKRLGKHRSAVHLAQYALKYEDERVQRHLVRYAATPS